MQAGGPPAPVKATTIGAHSTRTIDMALLFREPVTVLEGIETHRALSDLESAARWIMDNWPPEARSLAVGAQEACLHAFATYSERDAEAARAAIVEAAKAAEIYIEAR
jgi:hypothetical protein